MARLVDIGHIEMVPRGEGRVVQLGGTRIALFRTRQGAVYATQAECPHRGGPLADGIVGARTVVCPLHEYRFDLASGGAVGNSCPALKTYGVTVNGAGHVLVAADPD